MFKLAINLPRLLQRDGPRAVGCWTKDLNLNLPILLLTPTWAYCVGLYRDVVPDLIHEYVLHKLSPLTPLDLYSHLMRIIATRVTISAAKMMARPAHLRI